MASSPPVAAASSAIQPSKPHKACFLLESHRIRNAPGYSSCGGDAPARALAEEGYRRDASDIEFNFKLALERLALSLRASLGERLQNPYCHSSSGLGTTDFR